MPIPLLFIGIGAGAGVLGLGKTIKAGNDQIDANKTNETAKNVIERAQKDLDVARINCGNAIENLGKSKIKVLDDNIKPFIESFQKLHRVDFINSQGIEELSKFRIDEASFEELKEMQEMASGILGGFLSGSAMGVIAAYGAYGGAMALGTASTGTAIASLSGVAATNATLAFLGGGALSIGGLGMAGGSLVLGGLVAGPALAVMGLVIGDKASANKDRAYSNFEEARKFKEETEAASAVCKAIRMRANMFERLILRLNTVFEPLVYSLEQIIITSGTDYEAFSIEQKKSVVASMSMAAAIKAILDTPILTEEGALTAESKVVETSVKKMLANSNE